MSNVLRSKNKVDLASLDVLFGTVRAPHLILKQKMHEYPLPPLQTVRVLLVVGAGHEKDSGVEDAIRNIRKLLAMKSETPV